MNSELSISLLNHRVFMVFVFDCVQDDRSPLSGTEEEEDCDPEEPTNNPEQVQLYLGYDFTVMYINICKTCRFVMLQEISNYFST